MRTMTLCGLVLAGCIQDADEPKTCGEVVSDARCQTDDQCVCGHECFRDVCVQKIAVSRPPPPPPATQVSPQVQAYCTKISQVACEEVPLQECLAALTEGEAEATAAGCKTQFDGLLSCLVSTPLMCTRDDEGEERLELPPECERAVFAYLDCAEDFEPDRPSVACYYSGSSEDCEFEDRDQGLMSCDALSDGRFYCRCESGDTGHHVLVAGADACCDVETAALRACDL